MSMRVMILVLTIVPGAVLAPHVIAAQQPAPAVAAAAQHTVLPEPGDGLDPALARSSGDLSRVTDGASLMRLGVWDTWPEKTLFQDGAVLHLDGSTGSEARSTAAAPGGDPDGKAAPAGRDETDANAQTIAGLRYQWLGFLMASVTNARSHGQSPTAYGAALGHIIAASWPRNASPQMIGRGMAENFNLVGQSTAVVEDTPGRVVLRITPTDSAAFARDIARFGSSMNDYEAALRALIQAAAADRGLAWQERRDHDAITATLMRSR